MNTVISLLQYGMVAIFGIFLSASFCGIAIKKEATVKLGIFSAAALLIQLFFYTRFGTTVTKWVYPLILHLPLVLYFVIHFKKTWITAIVSVFLAYLCCQIPRWFADLTSLFFSQVLVRDIFYIVILSICYIILQRYAAKPFYKILTYSPRAVWVVGLLPALYYMFEYVTTVYTDILYSGNPYVVQTIPAIMCIGYVLFIIIYQSRLEEQEAIQQEHFLLSLQLRRSEAEFAALRKLQEQANRFHHDMRHHTTLLMEYAENGSIAQIKAYLQDLQQDLDCAVCKQYCRHQVVNLLLSHFESQANELGIELLVNADLPASLPFKDTELCSLLSNGLENAILATSKVQNPAKKVITVSLSVKQRNLLLSIQNPCVEAVTFVDGLPVASRPGHGLGTRSIASIVHNHGGLVHFTVSNDSFHLRASLPMEE